MSNIELDPIGSGFNRNKINENFQKIEEYLNGRLLDLQGESPLESQLDMNSNNIINLPEAISGSMAVPLRQVQSLVGGAIPDPETLRVLGPYSVTEGQTTLVLEESVGSPLLIIDGVTVIPDSYDGLNQTITYVAGFDDGQEVYVLGNFTAPLFNEVPILFVNTYADIANISLTSYPSIGAIITKGHTDAGVGSGMYVVDNTAVPDGGYAAATADGSVVRLNTEDVWAEQYGADPTYVRDSASAFNALNDLVADTSNSVVSGRWGEGRFKFASQAFYFKQGQGYRMWGSGKRSILDASEALDEFDLIGEAPEVVEGMIFGNTRIRGSNIGDSVCVQWAKCRNASRMQNVWIGEGSTGWGVHGVRMNAAFYQNMENVMIRNLTGDGLIIEATDFSDTVNALNIEGVYLNGNRTNVVARAADNTPNAVINFIGCTMEKSQATNMVFENFTSVNLIGCYSEANFPTAESGDITQILADRSEVNIYGGLFTEYDGGDAGARSFQSLDGGIFYFYDGVSLTEKNKGSMFADGTQYIMGFVRPVDWTAPYIRRFHPDKQAGADVQMVRELVPRQHAGQTTTPISGTISSYAGLRVLAALDFTTSASREAWGFRVIVQDAFSGAEVRYGRQEWAVAVRKQDNSYYFDNQEIYNLSGANNAHAVVSFVDSGSQLLIRVDTANSGASAELLNFTIEPILMQRNDRVTISEGY